MVLGASTDFPKENADVDAAGGASAGLLKAKAGAAVLEAGSDTFPNVNPDVVVVDGLAVDDPNEKAPVVWVVEVDVGAAVEVVLLKAPDEAEGAVVLVAPNVKAGAGVEVPACVALVDPVTGAKLNAGALPVVLAAGAKPEVLVVMAPGVLEAAGVPKEMGVAPKEVPNGLGVAGLEVVLKENSDVERLRALLRSDCPEVGSSETPLFKGEGNVCEPGEEKLKALLG